MDLLSIWEEILYTQSLLFQLALEAVLNNGALLTFSVTADWADIYRVHLNSCYNEMKGEKTHGCKSNAAFVP